MTPHEFYIKYWNSNGKRPEYRDSDKHFFDEVHKAMEFFKNCKIIEKKEDMPNKQWRWNSLSWTPQYTKPQMCFYVAKDARTLNEILFVEVKDFHTEKYVLIDLIQKLNFTPNDLQDTDGCLIRIGDYLIKNALFPYPAEILN